MDYLPPGHVVKIGDERFPRFVILDSLGQYWSGEERRWRGKPSEAVLFHTEIAAIEERNRHCLGGDVADTFTATVVVTVHARRWSKRELARHLRRHRKLFVGGPAGQEGILLEIVCNTLRKVKP
jgi:hypothetical protein